MQELFHEFLPAPPIARRSRAETVMTDRLLRPGQCARHARQFEKGGLPVVQDALENRQGLFEVERAVRRNRFELVIEDSVTAHITHAELFPQPPEVAGQILPQPEGRMTAVDAERADVAYIFSGGAADRQTDFFLIFHDCS